MQSPHPGSRSFAARATLGLVLLSTLSWAHANDGRNRYEQGVPANLFHLHAPVSAQAGFRVLAEDMANGADGDPAFRWVTRPALALLRLTSRRTHEVLGAAPFPYPVFDLASENGDTPLKVGPEGSRGRHPGGSHDGGVNLDLGYYLTSERGLHESPDYAACSEHHKPGAEGKPVDANICKGPADRLDTPRRPSSCWSCCAWTVSAWAASGSRRLASMPRCVRRCWPKRGNGRPSASMA